MKKYLITVTIRAMQPKIAVFSSTPTLEPAARALAAALHLAYQEVADYLLWLTPDYLGLRKTSEKSHPLFIDFTSGRMSHRRQQLSLRKELLPRALGLKGNTTPRIIDATAGLARDSFILAALGFPVELIERSPIIHALIYDGMLRAAQHPELAPIMQRMQLIQGDAAIWLQNQTEKPEIIYLDPMFPERTKSALSKLDMRIFHDLVGDDLDADLLLKTALTCATERVVVKRPRLAAALAGLKPDFSHDGSSNRFDVYLCRKA